jgi:sporulation protein YlmC with PRC-barrel domain
MLKTKDFQGKLLISVTDGKQLGEIKDVFLDKDAKEVIAVYLGKTKTGMLTRKTRIIHIEQIRLFGVDAWLVNGSDKISTVDEVEGAKEFILAEDLRGRMIQTDRKTKIGTVGDIIVNSNLDVIGFEFEKVHVKGPLSKANAIARAAITKFGKNHDPIVAALDQAEKMKIGDEH